jgi:hypothetical protein
VGKADREGEVAEVNKHLSDADRFRLRAMAAQIKRSLLLPERITAELRRGPATVVELCACIKGDTSEANLQLIRNALERMRKRGEVRRRPMQKWAGRRAQIADVLVWELVETKGEVAA